MENLDCILRSEGDFKWWLLLGAAGSGKSRLALEACILHESEWATGFLDKKFVDKTEWGRWQQKTPRSSLLTTCREERSLYTGCS